MTKSSQWSPTRTAKSTTIKTVLCSGGIGQKELSYIAPGWPKGLPYIVQF